MNPHLWHLVQHAARDEKNKKFSAICLIVIGFFFAPVLIGIPILIYGVGKFISAR